MKENYKNEVRYYTFPAFEEHPEIVHAFTSRECGVSGGYYSSLNMGIHTGDDLENVKTNYRILCQTLSLDPEKIVLANLVHGDTIRNVTVADAGAGLWRDFPYEGVDGLLTNEPGLILTATFADCVPVFFYDPVKKVIGIAHSGWKGTALEIASKMVDRMQSDYGCKVEDILAGIGPSIGMCCFETDSDVFMEFAEFPYLDEVWFYPKDDGKFDIDLWRINFEMLLYAGIPEDNISISGLCTCCNSDIFFSHRASKGKRGTMAGVISLKE